MTDSAVIVGAGGHAKVVLSTATAAGLSVIGLVDDDASKLGVEVGGIPVIGGLDASAGTSLVHGIGDNDARKTVTGRLHGPWLSVIHPSAVVDRTASIGHGVVVMASAVVQPDVALGDGVIINTSAVVEHDVEVGPFAHVAPGAVLTGGVRIGESALVGAGSVVSPLVSIGDGAVVGAGAVVLADVPAGATVVGNPARPIGT